jgi:hypothetical protein
MDEHAEMRVLKYMNENKINTSDAIITVVCWKADRDGKIIDVRCSRPCLECAVQLRMNGIKNIKYSIFSSDLIDVPMKIESIDEMFANIKTMHVSCGTYAALKKKNRPLNPEVMRILAELNLTT